MPSPMHPIQHTGKDTIKRTHKNSVVALPYGVWHENESPNASNFNASMSCICETLLRSQEFLCVFVNTILLNLLDKLNRLSYKVQMSWKRQKLLCCAVLCCAAQNSGNKSGWTGCSSATPPVICNSFEHFTQPNRTRLVYYIDTLCNEQFVMAYSQCMGLGVVQGMGLTQ